jgi:hypothetical protein
MQDVEIGEKRYGNQNTQTLIYPANFQQWRMLPPPAVKSAATI